jgi:hypothetical protein
MPTITSPQNASAGLKNPKARIEIGIQTMNVNSSGSMARTLQRSPD